MPRGSRPSLHPSRPLDTHLDASLMAQLDRVLWSDVEGRVPKGAYQRFFNERLREFFGEKRLDLGPYFGALPGDLTLRGKDEAIWRLEKWLQQHDLRSRAGEDLRPERQELP